MTTCWRCGGGKTITLTTTGSHVLTCPSCGGSGQQFPLTHVNQERSDPRPIEEQCRENVLIFSRPLLRAKKGMNLMVRQEAQTTVPPVRQPWPRRVFSYLFGYDFFISYSWQDGRSYAMSLYSQLSEQKYTCFLDSSGFQLGMDWTKAAHEALQITRALIVVGTTGALESGPVLGEVDDFRELDRPIFPIDIGRSLAGSPTSKLAEKLGGANAIRASEDASRQMLGPSEEVLHSIRNSFNLTKQYTRRVRWFASAAVLFAIIAGLATWFAIGENRERQEAEKQTGIAKKQTKVAKEQTTVAQQEARVLSAYECLSPWSCKRVRILRLHVFRHRGSGNANDNAYGRHMVPISGRARRRRTSDVLGWPTLRQRHHLIG
jgi:hypothetical protein